MWALYSVLSALGWSVSDAFSKKALENEDVSKTFILWGRFLFSIPFVLPFALIIKIPHLSTKFFYLHIFWLPLEIGAIYLYLNAIKISPISLSLPFLSLTPLFLIFTGFIFLNEIPSKRASFGILLLVLGSYVMNIEKREFGFTEPFKAIFKEKGTRIVILVAFLYSITSIIGKELVLLSSPFFFTVYYTIIMTLATLPFGVLGVKEKRPKITISVILSGIFYGFMILFHMLAIRHTMVSYMIGLKRLSGVFSVILGYIFFKEKHIKTRLLGALFMVTGAIFITIG